MKNHRGEESKRPWKHVHGHSTKGDRSPTYVTWTAMHGRCNQKSKSQYHGKGVTVCERWSDFNNFLHDMGERPDGKTVDRIDPNGNYEPENCRWATPKEQARNKRESIYVVIDGVEINLAELSDKYDIPPTTIYRRYHQGLRGSDLISRESRLKLRVGDKCSSSKLNEEQVRQIKRLLLSGVTGTEIARIFGVRQPTISDIKRGRSWAHVKLETGQSSKPDNL